MLDSELNSRGKITIHSDVFLKNDDVARVSKRFRLTSAERTQVYNIFSVALEQLGELANLIEVIVVSFEEAYSMQQFQVMMKYKFVFATKEIEYQNVKFECEDKVLLNRFFSGEQVKPIAFTEDLVGNILERIAWLVKGRIKKFKDSLTDLNKKIIQAEKGAGALYKKSLVKS
jgi:hypothetical protein